VDHWVALEGVVCVALATTSATASAVILGVRPGRGASLTPALDAKQKKGATPQGNRACAHSRFGGDSLILQAIGGKQNDAAAHNYPRSQRTLATEPLQFCARSWIEYDCMGNTHGKVSSA
jgi:hypothetical protein